MAIKIISILLCISIFSACSTNDYYKKTGTENNPFTHGNVQMTVKKGITTKQDVLNTFGAPNITTIDATGKETWTYQKYATVTNSESSDSYATIILAGAKKDTSGFESTSRTMTMILKFDTQNKVEDFKSMSSSF